LFAPDSDIRPQAARALGQIGGINSLKALLTHLRRRDPSSLLDTIDSLARIGDDAAIPPLIMLFHDIDDEQVRHHIAAALGRMTQTESIEEVAGLLQGRRPVGNQQLK
jgi:HEAT repeat protein